MGEKKGAGQGLLMETGVSYNKQRLHKLGYFTELISSNDEVSESIRPLLKLSRETICAITDRRCLALPVDQAGHQLLRALQRGEELRRQARSNADLQTEEQAYPADA